MLDGTVANMAGTPVVNWLDNAGVFVLNCTGRQSRNERQVTGNLFRTVPSRLAPHYRAVYLQWEPPCGTGRDELVMLSARLSPIVSDLEAGPVEWG